MDQSERAKKTIRTLWLVKNVKYLSTFTFYHLHACERQMILSAIFLTYSDENNIYFWKWYSLVEFILKQLFPSVSVPSEYFHLAASRLGKIYLYFGE